jgi:hypothetical protein
MWRLGSIIAGVGTMIRRWDGGLARMQFWILELIMAVIYMLIA